MNKLTSFVATAPSDNGSSDNRSDRALSVRSTLLKVISKLHFEKIFDKLFNTRAAGLYIILFASSIGIATFIENDFGTSSAQKVVFKTLWFELLLVLFGISILTNIWRFRMIQLKKWSLFLFHFSMIVILIGAGITRYFGYEGIMHIRQNESANSFLSAETFLQFEVIKGQQKYQFSEPVLFATLGNNNWKESYLIGNDLIEVEVEDFIPNPRQGLVESSTGVPIIKIVIGGAGGREEYFLKEGETKRIRGLIYTFSADPISNAINIIKEGDGLSIKSNRVLTQMVMATQHRDTLYPREEVHPLRLRSLYSDGVNSFVFGDYHPSAVVEVSSEEPKVKNESMTALKVNTKINGVSNDIYVYGKKGLPGRPAFARAGDVGMAMSYGAKPITVPFSISLKEFIMERYPGTNSAASYASEVQLNDPSKNKQIDYRIFMNNILDYGGYRFFQSSFDKDEQGTYLSVNYDFWGTWVSYLGYFLLTLGLFLTFFDKKSRFYKVTQEIGKIRRSATVIVLLACSCLTGASSKLSAQKVISPITQSISAGHAELFSKVVVQDHKGRMKPMHTLTREVLRKVSRKESINGLSADQVLLGMFADKSAWIAVPMIKISHHQQLIDLIGVSSKLASYRDFFETSGAYKLREEVRRAYGLQPIDRGTFEKELLKIDERVNIVSMIYSGRLFKIVPVPNDPNDLWVSNQVDHGSSVSNPVAQRLFPAYQSALISSLNTGDYSLPNQILAELKGYQGQNGRNVMPSDTKISAEVLLNKMDVFGKLSFYYIILGLVFLILLFTSIMKPHLPLHRVFKVLLFFVIAGFLFHTLGLGIRWYVSGRAPWSNGYETLIYIAWTSSLAGLLFTRKSIGGLAATMVLAGTILLVAMLSYLDPEITPLVPVLKSYWLTIHVSLIAGSYGFLMLGAIIGLVNLILMVFLSEANKKRMYRVVREMSYISEVTLIGGLAMISVGTYLGGVWANESWGRYWGWDAKETWALVTILVYAFILHMRLIPGLKSLYAYNVAKLVGWASVIMTYFGVNYYLSGLHSYAAGDPIPIPNWVYVSVASMITISILAFIRKRRFAIF